MGLNMDNFRFDVTARHDVGPALAVAFLDGRMARSWRVDDAPDGEDRGARLFLSSADPTPSWWPLIVPLGPDDCTVFVTQWLDALSPAQYGRYPSHDGDNSKGWRVFNDTSILRPLGYGPFVVIEATWAWHGK